MRYICIKFNNKIHYTTIKIIIFPHVTMLLEDTYCKNQLRNVMTISLTATCITVLEFKVEVHY